MKSLQGAKPGLDWDDPEARRDHLAELVAVGRALLEEVAGSEDPALTEPATLLARVIDQDAEADFDAGDPRPRI